MGSISGADENSLQRLITKHSGPKKDFAPGQVHAVRSKEDLEDMQATGMLLVTEWYAQWCGPCKTFKPTFQEIAKEYAEFQILFCTIDVDENKELTADHGIRSMPTFKASGRAIIRIAKSKYFSML